MTTTLKDNPRPLTLEDLRAAGGGGGYYRYKLENVLVGSYS